MIVTLSSVRGAPGVTSWSMLLAAAWPADYGMERVVLEAATSGGVLGARYGLGVEPGAASLVAAVRRRSESGVIDLSDVGRLVSDGVWVVPETESAERAHALWSAGTNATDVASAIEGDDRAWLVDAGRPEPGSPLRPFVSRSSLSLVVCGPTQEELVQVPTRVHAHQQLATSVGVLIVGHAAYDQQELREFFGTGLVWVVDASKDLVQLVGALSARRRARSTIVWRQAVELAAEIAERTTTDAPTRPRDTDAVSGVVSSDRGRR